MTINKLTAIIYYRTGNILNIENFTKIWDRFFFLTLGIKIMFRIIIENKFWNFSCVEQLG